MVEYTIFQSPIGPLSIMAVKDGVVNISFQNVSIPKFKKSCQRHLTMEVIEGNDFTVHAKEQILNYFRGKRQSLDFPVVHINTPFRKKVLEAERNITYGQTSSYREIAQMVNKPRAYRAVGSANANNPLPLYFPCHRIINSNGKLGGFGGGIEVKRFLLNLESQHY